MKKYKIRLSDLFFKKATVKFITIDLLLLSDVIFSRLCVMGFFLSPFIYLSIATFIFSPVCHSSVYPVLHFFCAVSSSTSLPVSSSSTSFDEHLHNLLCIGFESTWQLTIFAATRSIDFTANYIMLRRLVSMI